MAERPVTVSLQFVRPFNIHACARGKWAEKMRGKLRAKGALYIYKLNTPEPLTTENSDSVKSGDVYRA